jgi:hypothetical protein
MSLIYVGAVRHKSPCQNLHAEVLALQLVYARKITRGLTTPPKSLMAEVRFIENGGLTPQYCSRTTPSRYPLPVLGTIYTGTLSGRKVLVKRFYQLRKNSLGEKFLSVVEAFGMSISHLICFTGPERRSLLLGSFSASEHTIINRFPSHIELWANS